MILLNFRIIQLLIIDLFHFIKSLIIDLLHFIKFMTYYLN